MLDYVNSLNQKRGVSRLTIVSLAISCFFHFCVIMALYLFPQLLAGGYLHQFRGFRWGTVITDEDMEDWRMVAILERPDRMNMPSRETLRSLGLGNRDDGAGSPPIEVSFGPPEAMETDKPPLPQIPPKIEEPEIVIPDNRRPGEDDTTKPDAGSSVESPKPEPAEPGTGRDFIAAKPDEAAPKIEIASNVVPREIPDTIQPPAPPQPPAKPDEAKSATVNEAASKSASKSGVEFLDSGGFPMGEYRDIISELIRSKWLIPSNLKNTFGRTAVIFYIDRNGRVIDLRVETSSGNRSLDTAALSAVYTAVPLPPLPKDFPRERVGVRMFLIYEP